MRRVLVLDDHPGLARTIALGLGVAGSWGIDFSDSIEAIKALQDKDILLTDLSYAGNDRLGRCLEGLRAWLERFSYLDVRTS